MGRFIFKRVLQMIPVLLGISIIIFTIMQLAPGEPARLILGEKATEEQVRELSKELGTDRPAVEQYFKYMIGLLKGDFGRSYRTRQPVLDEIVDRFPTTFILAMLVMVVSTGLSVPFGVLASLRQNSLFDAITTVIALLLMAMPSFWLGLLLMLVFSVKLDLLPAIGSTEFIHFIMPTITLSAGNIAVNMRMTRSSMLEVIRQDYIRTARAKGASEKTVVIKHALKNALIPVVTSIGINFGSSLGGAVLIESVFSMKGIGTLILTGVRNQDLPVVMGGILVTSFLFSIVTLLVDISYGYIDPRIKAQYKNER